MKKLLLSFALLSALPSVAQTYSFSTYTDTYVELANPTSLSNGDVWDDPWYSVPLGFDFQLFDTTVNELTFHADLLGGSLMVQRAGQLDLFLVITAVGDDIADRGSNTGVSESDISYELTGTAGSHILKLQWKNAGFYGDLYDDGDPATTDSLNLQLWLYEGSDIIEMHYGPSLVQSASLGGGDGLTLSLSNNYNWNTLAVEEGVQLTGDATAPTAAAMTLYQSASLTGVPSNGRVYRFAPGWANINELDISGSLRLYPNPANDEVYLNFDERVEISSIRLLDAFGRTVESTSSTVNQLDVSNYESGIYFIEVLTDKGRASKMIVKK